MNTGLEKSPAAAHSSSVLGLAICSMIGVLVSAAPSPGQTPTYRSCPIPIAAAPVAVVSDDFNTDGTSDIAFLDRSNRRVVISLSNDSSMQKFSVGSCVGALTDTDVFVGAEPTTLDVLRDVVPVNLAVAENAGVRVLVNNQGTFSASDQSPISTGSVPLALASALLARETPPDTLEDIIAAGSDIKILYGTAPGRFTSPTPAPNPGSPTRQILARDLNGDEKPDLLALSSQPGITNQISIILAMNAAFAPATSFRAGDAPRAMAVCAADDPSACSIDDDEVPDIAVVGKTSAGEGVLTILFGSLAAVGGTVTYDLSNSLSLPAGIEPVSVAIARIDSDRFLDVVVADQGGDAVLFYFGDGDGGLTRGNPCPQDNVEGGGCSVHSPAFLAIGRLDENNDQDVIVGSSTVNPESSVAELTVLLSSNPPVTPTFTPSATPTITPTTTPTGTITPTPTPPTSTPTRTVTNTPVPTNTGRNTSTPTPTATETPSGAFALQGECAIEAGGPRSFAWAPMLFGVALGLLRRKNRKA